MQNLHKAAKASPQTVLPVLKSFIGERLLLELEQAGDQSDHVCEWLEKATITYVHLATTQTTEARAEMLDDIQELLDRLQASRESMFSTKATHAAQTLLWKASGDADRSSSYKWCDLLRHPLFDNAGHLNKARIGRRVR